jgi:Lrp/AsnC family leucine-responsive transcriptional regulator
VIEKKKKKKMIQIQSEGKIMVKKSKKELQEDELRILRELQQNAKENIETIAKHCGFSRQKVWRVIKQLEERGMIWGYTAVIDQEMMNQEQFILLIKKTTKPLPKEIMEKIDSMDLEDIALLCGAHIEGSYFIHGNYDWLISLTAKDVMDARKFCQKLSEEFPGAIQQCDIQQVLYCVRKHYIFNPDRKKLKDLMK